MSDKTRVVPFDKLSTADLQVEAVYLGGSSGNVNDDPLNLLVEGIGNQGGFRYAGSPTQKTVRLCVLYTSGGEVDWPDSLDPFTGHSLISAITAVRNTNFTTPHGAATAFCAMFMKSQMAAPKQRDSRFRHSYCLKRQAQEERCGFVGFSPRGRRGCRPTTN